MRRFSAVQTLGHLVSEIIVDLAKEPGLCSFVVHLFVQLSARWGVMVWIDIIDGKKEILLVVVGFLTPESDLYS